MVWNIIINVFPHVHGNRQPSFLLLNFNMITYKVAKSIKWALTYANLINLQSLLTCGRSPLVSKLPLVLIVLIACKGCHTHGLGTCLETSAFDFECSSNIQPRLFFFFAPILSPKANGSIHDRGTTFGTKDLRTLQYLGTFRVFLLITKKLGEPTAGIFSDKREWEGDGISIATWIQN